MHQRKFGYHTMAHVALTDIDQRLLKTIITLQQSGLLTRIQVVVLKYSYFPRSKVYVHNKVLVQMIL